MSNPSNQLAQRRHLLSLHQLGLSLLEAVKRVLKLLRIVLELEFGRFEILVFLLNFLP